METDIGFAHLVSFRGICTWWMYAVEILERNYLILLLKQAYRIKIREVDKWIKN